jgi:hypothetical protein
MEQGLKTDFDDLHLDDESDDAPVASDLADLDGDESLH